MSNYIEEYRTCQIGENDHFQCNKNSRITNAINLEIDLNETLKPLLSSGQSRFIKIGSTTENIYNQNRTRENGQNDHFSLP